MTPSWFVLPLSLLGLLLGAGGDSMRSARDNPHGDPRGCAACHVMVSGEGAASVGEALPIMPTCRSCHPTADMHPVGMPSVDVPIAEGFPLDEGLVSCWTCHVEPAHGGAEMVPPPYHRGGPYEPVTDLCYACHERTSYTRSNPHHPAAPRSPDDESCTACHRTNPDTGALPQSARLRSAAAEACDTCHVRDPHLGAGSHLGKKVEAAMLDRIPAELPLDNDGTIACWTCHDVHGPPAEGASPVGRRWLGNRVFADALRTLASTEDWVEALPAEARWPGQTGPDRADPLLALPTADGTLCEACHGDGP